MDQEVYRLELDPSGQHRVFLGDDWGAEVRGQHKLDELDQRSVMVEVVCPDESIVVTNAFIRGLFRPSIFRLAETHSTNPSDVIAAFWQKFHFVDSSGAEVDVREGIEDEIPRSLRQYQHIKEQTHGPPASDNSND